MTDAPTFDLVIEGEPGTIPVTSLVRALEHALALIQGVDSVITRLEKGMVDWYVADLRIGSLGATLMAKPKKRQAIRYQPHIAEDIMSAVIEGVAAIEATATVPPSFPEPSMRRVQRLANLITEDGARAFNFDLARPVRHARVSERSAEHAKQALKPRYRANGSVVGTLEVISVHRQRLFSVYDEISRRAVRGYFTDEIMDLVKEALGQRVAVDGVVSRNGAGDLVSVLVDQLQVLPDEDDLPTVSRLVGSDPRFTGDKPTEQYLGELRRA